VAVPRRAFTIVFRCSLLSSSARAVAAIGRADGEPAHLHSRRRSSCVAHLLRACSPRRHKKPPPAAAAARANTETRAYATARVCTEERGGASELLVRGPRAPRACLEARTPARHTHTRTTTVARSTVYGCALRGQAQLAAAAAAAARAALSLPALLLLLVRVAGVMPPLLLLPPLLRVQVLAASAREWLVHVQRVCTAGTMRTSSLPSSRPRSGAARPSRLSATAKAHTTHELQVQLKCTPRPTLRRSLLTHPSLG
jgi:hypothetical protein